MINPGLNSVLTNTLHSTYRQKEISPNTSLDIYSNSDTSDESWEEYNKQKRLNKKLKYFSILTGFIGVITCFILSKIIIFK